MKEAFDKEFDSLLRRHARGRGVVGAPEARATPEASHLDADELSAFAEGALPAPARVAAVSHLADCERCRGIVVAVARASGFELAPEKGAAAAVAAAGAAAREPTRPAGWGAWLSALFAPRVMRYAVPVLALCAVGVVSFVALRSSRQNASLNANTTSTQVASDASRPVETQPNTSGAVVPEGSPAAANANNDGLVARSAGEAPRGSITSEVPAPVTASPGQGGGDAAGGGASASAPTASGVATDQPAPPPPAERPETASEAPPASKAGPAEEREADKKSAGTDTKTDENREKRAAAEPTDTANSYDYAQNRAQSRANETQMQTQSPDGSRNRAANKEQPGFRGGSLAGAAPAPKTEERDSVESRRARKSAPEARKDESEGERGRADDETARTAETRSAAGHRFVRKDGAWYDVNYKPAMPSTGVRRGTESFRALVADLPEIGRAAEQLSGEFYIVIRGRAYRVR